MRLSVSFAKELKDGEEPDLEVKCVVYNINPGRNEGLLGKSEALRGYTHFVEKVRTYRKGAGDLEKAIDRAINECIDEKVLDRFFRTRRDEIKKTAEWILGLINK